MGFLHWLGKSFGKLRRTRTLPATATDEERNRALHAPASNQQSPHSYGRKVKGPQNGTSNSSGGSRPGVNGV